MFSNLTGWHALIILAVVVLLFGATKLPALARSVGQSVRILKKEVAEPATVASPIVAESAVAEPAVAEPVVAAPAKTERVTS
ncbi:MAG: twin-arginine translocase TatA/TatE family subunit [Microbacteriaceae bacterium]